MRQAIEITKLPLCDAPRLSWLGRLRDRLFGSDGLGNTILLQHRSEHLLRDIGLSDDLRANHLLRDQHLFRR